MTLVVGLTAAVLLASCSQPGNAATTAPSASHSTSASQRIDISVKGKQVTPAPAMVNIAIGQELTITVTSDHDGMLHEHAFNVEQNIKAGHRAEFTVKGAQPGVSDVELHLPDLRLLQIAVH